MTVENEILKQGGRYPIVENDTHAFSNMLRPFVNRLNRHCRNAERYLYDERPRKIDVSLIRNSKINAFACASAPADPDPVDFIGINLGAVVSMLDTFNRMLSHPEIFPEIGSAHKEQKGRSFVQYLVTDVIDNERELVIPIDPSRTTFAGFLAQSAIDFLFFHELTHLRNGHLEFKQQSGTTILDETIQDIGEHETALTSQSLEMDADAGAVLRSLIEAHGTLRSFHVTAKELEPNLLEALTHAYGSPRLATRTVLFSAYALFRLFDISTWDPFSIEKYSHVQIPLRMHWLGATMYSIFEKNSQKYMYTVDNFLSDAAEMILGAELAFGLIQNAKPDARGLRSVVEPAPFVLVDNHLNRLKKEWSRVRPFLERYKRGGQLANE